MYGKDEYHETRAREVMAAQDALLAREDEETVAIVRRLRGEAVAQADLRAGNQARLPEQRQAFQNFVPGEVWRVGDGEKPHPNPFVKLIGP